MTYIPTHKILQSGTIENAATGASGTVIDTRAVGTGANVNTTRHTVTFPFPFDSVPEVVVGMEGDDDSDGQVIACRVESGTLTATGFNFLVSDMGTGHTVTFHWLATVGL